MAGRNDPQPAILSMATSSAMACGVRIVPRKNQAAVVAVVFGAVVLAPAALTVAVAETPAPAARIRVREIR